MKRRKFLKWMLVLSALYSAIWYGFLRKLIRDQEVVLPAQTGGNQSNTPPKPDEEAEPLLGDQLGISFFVISDLHISGGVETPSKLNTALADIQAYEPKPAALAITGDLTDLGLDSEYKELSKVITKYKLPPIHANMGNHDYYSIWIDKFGAFNRENLPNGKTDAQSRERFMKFFGYSKPYHDVWINGYHFIFLSQELYVQEKPEVGEGAWHSDEQFAWLQEKAALHKDGKPFFVMIHQPLPPAQEDGGSHRFIRAKKFREILKPYKNVFVFSGHHHQDFEGTYNHYEKETFHWFHNSSVGKVLNRNFQEEAKDKVQGLHVEVYGNRVIVKARDFKKKSWIKDWTVKLVKV